MHQSHAMMKKYRIVPGIIQLGVVIGVTQQKKKVGIPVWLSLQVQYTQIDNLPKLLPKR